MMLRAAATAVAFIVAADGAAVRLPSAVPSGDTVNIEQRRTVRDGVITEAYGGRVTGHPA
jgi:hypothetical protein